MAYPIIPCDLCGSQEGLQRAQVKKLLDDWEARTPGAAAGDVPVADEPPRLSGSVSLLGGVFDDIGLKDYHETLDANSPEVKVLTHETNDTIKPYWANFGWRSAAGATGPALPGYDALWTIEKGDKLTATTPVTLRWDNGAGLIFRREIAVDDNFMFTVTQSVENQTGAAVKLTPFSLVVRDGAPHSVATYVRHEGAIRMADGKLKEVTYKKLPQDRPFHRFDRLGLVLLPDQADLLAAALAARPDRQHGLAIIALTFIMKLLVLPAGLKSYISMARMKELQPEMEALKERTAKTGRRCSRR
jgi:hypothetical protein